MKRIVLIMIFCFISLLSFGEVLVLKDGKKIEGEIMDYQKELVSILTQPQMEMLDIMKSKIEYIAFKRPSENMFYRIKDQLGSLPPQKAKNPEIIVFKNGKIKPYKIVQFTRASLMVDDGENIQELPVADLFGIYFLSSQPVAEEKKIMNYPYKVQKKDGKEFEASAIKFKPESVLILAGQFESELKKSEISWIILNTGIPGLFTKAESEYTQLVQTMKEKDLLLTSQGKLIPANILKMDDKKLTYVRGRRTETLDLKEVLGIYYGPKDKNAVEAVLPSEKKPEAERGPEQESAPLTRYLGNEERTEPQRMYLESSWGAGPILQLKDERNFIKNDGAQGFIRFNLYFPVMEELLIGFGFTHAFYMYKSYNYYFKEYDTDINHLGFATLNLKIFTNRIMNGLFLNLNAGVKIASQGAPTYSNGYETKSAFMISGGLGYAFERVKYDSAFLIGFDVNYIAEKNRFYINEGTDYSFDTKTKRIALLFYGGVLW